MIITNLSQRTQNSLRSIRSLPIPIGYYTDLSEPYVAERKNIRTEKQLKAFTRRWTAVWKIPWANNWQLKDSEKQIISGRYSAKKILRCIDRNSSGGQGCHHIRRNKHCISADILAPAFLLRMLEIRNHFGVPDGVALLQVTRALHEDLRDEDPDGFFQYINEHKKLVVEDQG